MLRFHDHPLTLLAVFMTDPKSVAPAEVTIGLSLICVIAVAVALVTALRRNQPMYGREAPRGSLQESLVGNHHIERIRKAS